MADTEQTLPAAWGGEGNKGVPKKNSRRAFLAGATAAVGAVGVGAAMIPFVRSWMPSAKAKAVGGPVKVDISRLKEGEMLVVAWRSQPIFVVRMTPEMVEASDREESRLADPISQASDQPEYVDPAARSVRP